MMLRPLLRSLGLALGLSAIATAAENGRGRDQRVPNQPTQNSPCLNVPVHPFDVVLGRPTRDSVTASVLTYQDAEGCLAYGTQRGVYPQQTPTRPFKNGQPLEIVLGSLRPDTQYFYQLRLGGNHHAEGTFHTQRPPGSTFSFTIIADSHLDSRVSADFYQRTLADALTDAPDFHIDLGDTFMTEKHDHRENATRQYLAQRFYFGQLCASAPLFLVLGNHDGENPHGRGRDPEGLALWSNGMRKRYFPNPVPDGFFSGDATPYPAAGLLQDYYAWQWGDALFVVLDPFWFSQSERGQGNNWSRSLGADQYHWLQRTLAASQARFKFIFIHHLIGGLNDQCRGGAEAATFFEWGGQNADHTDGFNTNRPGWPVPIHQLLVQNRVSIVFHGHDHLYAQQNLDGIVYQEVPQPGNPGGDRAPRSAAEYGYVTGTILGGSGYLRTQVTPTAVRVEYRCESDGACRTTHAYVLRPASVR
jgi:predicted phosphodiesterase